MDGNLVHALYAPRAAASEALRFAGGEVWSTDALRRKVGQMARALKASGVAPGDRVSFKLEKSPEVLVLAHACFQLGAVIHPLNTTYTPAEITYLVADAAPRLLVASAAEADELSALTGARTASLEAGMGGALGAAAASADPLCDVHPLGTDAVAAILYTSGTTGRPKGACITHGNLAESARALAEVWRMTPGDRLLHALPLYHAHGLLTSVNTALVAGASILLLERFEAAEVVAALPDASVIMGVPTHYARLLSEAGIAAATRGLRLAISGSAPLPLELAERFLAATGMRIIERYGATETAIVTALPAGTEDRAGFVGWALPGVEIRTRADDGTTASQDAVGGLETRGHNVFAGYWRRPEADAEAFTADGWFITGDVAEIDAGGCVRLLGRSKDIIITGGLNVYPKEVEDVLDGILGAGESCVFGVPHPDFGEAVVAVVEGAVVDEPELQRAMKLTLAAYKVPKRILPVTAIPRNRMGKVLKRDLRTAHGDLFTDPKQQTK
jgi:malonyl-CoA/methylmalonyl-CoA synthetase